MACWIVCAIASLALTVAPASASVAPSPAPTRAGLSAPVFTQSSIDVRVINDLIDRNHRSIGSLPGSVASWSGVISEAGIDVRYTTVAHRDGRYRTSYELPFGERGEGSDGVTNWSSDLNGNVVTEPVIHRRSFLTRLLGYNAALYDESIAWTRGGSARIDGRNVEKLSAQFGKDQVLFYLDAKTGLVYGVDVGARSVRYTQYQTFGELTLPAKEVETAGDSTVTATVTELRFSTISLESFAPPQPRKPQFPTGDSEVALDFQSPHDLIIVSALINDKPANLLLDSGSSASLIDLDEAKRLGLPTAGSSHVAAATLLSGTTARVDSLSLGGILFKPFVFQAVPLGLPPSIRGYGIKGILGYDVLAQLVARIDYKRARLRFIAPASFTYTGTGTVIALDARSRLPRINATIGQSDSATFTLDTGSDAGLIVYQEFASAHQRDLMRPGDLASDAPAMPLIGQTDVTRFFGDLTRASGAGGSIRVKTGYVSRIGLGSFEVARVFTEIVLEPSGAFAPSVSDGLLGAGVLSQFGAVFLDYSGGRLILER